MGREGEAREEKGRISSCWTWPGQLNGPCNCAQISRSSAVEFANPAGAN